MTNKKLCIKEVSPLQQLITYSSCGWNTGTSDVRAGTCSITIGGHLDSNKTR